jgi:DNA-binding SARP family transcriptional activator/Tfp pilus assembly protein PilF
MLEIRLFGGLEMQLDGAPVSAFMSSKVPALLAYLAVTHRPHQRDTLAALLWGELPDADARNNLRQALVNLRRLLAPYLTVTRDTVAFNPTESFCLDTAQFETLLDSVSALDPEVRPRQWQEATALYTDDFLAGFLVRDAPAFEEWMLGHRARYQELALYAMHQLAQHHLDSGQYGRAINIATRLLAIDAWREEAHRQLMEALARTGRRSAAVAQYQRCRRLLREELGVDPSAELTALYERIKASLHGPKHNLPAALPSPLGRQAELAQLRRRLASPACRLLTLVGPGGGGKTCLALAAASEHVYAMLDGVYWVPLDPAASPAELIGAISNALGFVFSGAHPLEDQLIDYLRSKELLLVLDNFEHLIAPFALTLLSRLLAHAPHLKLLVTSRVRLNLTAEWLVDVTGLAYPPGHNDAEAETYPAVQLFGQSARRIQPDFALTPTNTAAVARICRLVEGLPLAIELAAAWARTMTPEMIVAELGRGLAFLASTAYDVPDRHRSLAAVFEHSWRLLVPDAQSILARLAVFRGGFEAAAAEAVAGPVGAALQVLVDRSLLRVNGSGKYAMHPLVQQFAGEKLAQTAETVTHQALCRHAHYFAGLVHRSEGDFHGPQDRQALARMVGEVDNIRAAWRWAAQQAEAALLEQFLESFLYFFDIQGRYAECVDLTGGALPDLRTAAEGRNLPQQRRGLGRVLALHAAFQFRVGEFECARQNAQEALALLEPLGPHRDEAHARLYLGAAWYGLGNLEQSVHWFLAAAQAYEAAGHAWGIGAALDNAGFLEFLRGNGVMAESYLTRALAVARQTGSRYLLTGVYDHLATLTAAQGRFAEAMDFVDRCRQVLNELDRPYIVASLSLSLSRIAAQAGNLAAAGQHLERALSIARETGNRLDIVQTLIRLAQVQGSGGQMAAAQAALDEAAALGREIHAESLLVDVAAGLADLALAAGRRREAAALYRTATEHAAASHETAGRAAGRLRKLGNAAHGQRLSLDAALGLGLAVRYPENG